MIPIPCLWLCTRPWHICSLWPSDAIWWHRSRSTLAQVMGCCLTAPSHYLNQCWLIISKYLWYSPGNIIIRRFEDTNKKSKFENHIFKIASSCLSHQACGVPSALAVMEIPQPCSKPLIYCFQLGEIIRTQYICFIYVLIPDHESNVLATESRRSVCNALLHWLRLRTYNTFWETHKQTIKAGSLWG